MSFSALRGSVVSTLLVDFILCVPILLAWNAATTSSGPLDLSKHFTLSGSVIDIALLCLVRLFVSVLALTWPTKWAVSGISPARVRTKKLQKSLGWGHFMSAAIAISCGNYALVKCLSLVVSDVGMPSGPDNQTNVDLADALIWSFEENEIATFNPATFWFGLIATVLFSFIDYKAVGKTLNAYQDAVLKRRRTARRAERNGNGDLSASLLANPTSNAISEEQEEEEEDGSSDEESESEAAELQRQYRQLAHKKGTAEVSDGVRQRLRERMQRVKRRQRKKKREKEDKDSRSTSASVSALITLSKPDIWFLLFAFVCLVIAAIAQALVPKYTGEVINYVSDTVPDKEGFYHTLVLLVIAAVVCGIFSGLRGATFTLCMARLVIRVRHKLFRALLEQEVGYFDVTNIGDITSRLSADTTKMSDQISLNLNVLLRSIVEGILYLILMVNLSWKLALLSFISIPLMTAISHVYGGYYRKLSKYTQDALADANSIAEEALGAVTTVRDFAADRSEGEAYGEELNEFLLLTYKQVYAYSGFALTWTTIPSLVTAITLYYGGLLVMEPSVQDSHIKAGDLVSFMFYQQSLSRTFSSIGNILTGISGALGAADKVFQIINRQPKITPSGSLQMGTPKEDHYDNNNNNSHSAIGVTHPEGTFDGSITLENISFTYPARPGVVVLKDFSLHVPAGKVVALVGPSGGGKSSCIRLIQHYYEPTTGRVLISGKPVEEFDPVWLRRQVAIVGQEPTLFGRSIRRNIIYGLEGTEDEPSEAAIMEAAKLSNAHEFIMSMPKGYDTEVGERGVQLSGGQKQRIALARSLVRQPEVLLLDEATSALDTESEAVVQAALDRIMRQRGRTVLVIAHRLSTVKNADLIVCIADGRVAEQGTHAELLATNGVYATLVQRQLEGMKTSPNTSSTEA